ncbi:autophagy-related protein 22-like protein [Radiomyces spectabilis]|uniref:autophagy-related protein 22-like protein n=1 Tax=Radiomyces spectabilis TaxID=64574 RepID=UPI00221F8765|nr:autophagy-related protein 22-like protein [Radiomyces spectabilis]KAI8393887.1 autophagy-related protein 22-like protein [Radiomyces spectabilis]
MSEKEESLPQNISLKDSFFADPFVSSDADIDPSSEQAQAVLKQPPATKKELWGYYLYYNGDNGYTMFSYMPNILQYLAYRGGFNPETPNVRGCDVNDAMKPCNVAWMGKQGGIPVSSMMLYVQAIAFSLQFFLFTTFGSLADYGRWNWYILLFATVIGCAAQIVPVAFVNDDGSHWNAMMGIMIIALIAYGTSLVFYGAAFPQLSDNLPVVRKARADPTLTRDEILTVSEKWRNQVSAVSTVFSNVGFLVMTGILSGVSYTPWSNYDFPPGVDHVLGNVPLYNFISTVVCGAYWVLNALPYFVFRPVGRRGPNLPEGSNHFTIGWKSIFLALKEAKKLRYLFMYIFSYFMFSDAVSTTNQMIAIVQAEITSFSARQLTILNLASAITSIIGCLFFLWISKRFGVRTKVNLLIIVTLSAIIPIWGCFGIGLDNFGIKTTWELWVFYVWSGLFTAPIWAWQQTMLAELIPKGKENLFFGLFGVVNKASSWIGPVVIGAITEHTNNLWKGWPFVLGLFIIAIVIVIFIDVDKAKLELVAYQAAIQEQEEAQAQQPETERIPSENSMEKVASFS